MGATPTTNTSTCTNTTPSMSNHIFATTHAWHGQRLAPPTALQRMASSPRGEADPRANAHAKKASNLYKHGLAYCVPICWNGSSPQAHVLSPDLGIHSTHRRRLRWGKLACLGLNAPACMTPPQGMLTFFAQGGGGILPANGMYMQGVTQHAVRRPT